MRELAPTLLARANGVFEPMPVAVRTNPFTIMQRQRVRVTQLGTPLVEWPQRGFAIS
jgi:hypothetical protein